MTTEPLLGLTEDEGDPGTFATVPLTADTTIDGDYLADPSDLSVRTGLAEDDPLLMLELRRATGRFRAECGHHVTRTTETVYVSGRGTHHITLPGLPIHGTPTVVEDGVELTIGVDFSLSRKSGIMRRRGELWPDGLDNIEVTYTYGSTTIPVDVSDAVLEAAEIAITLEQAGVEMATSGGESVKFANSLVNGGVTTRWADAVARHETGRGDSS